MSILRILTYGDDRLQTPAKAVEKITPEIRKLIADMAETMHAAKGVGLAATQVGVMARLCVVNPEAREGGGEETSKPAGHRVFINPQIIWTSDEDVPMSEGCLSLPGIEAEVFRPSAIRVRYRDERWQVREEEMSGLLARILQHEIDHLDGVLFVDRVGFVRRHVLAGQLRKLRKERESIFVPAALAGDKG
ncbi:MAG: peptide deformylase [Candidatus Sumerlaeia bacterium]|nr:peptide deformylase [Candidatus Sumerlaeia bacterium]